MNDWPPLRVLGPVSLHVGGVAGPAGGPTARRLLAVLIVNRNVVVHTDRLIDVLWGDTPPVTATSTMRSHVSRLRSQLPPAVTLEGIPPGYRLQVAAGGIDSERFEVALGAALDLMPGAPDVALGKLDIALALWRGDALAEFAGERWARGEAARLEELRLDAREARLAALLTVDRVDLATAEARQLTVEHPERERGWAVLVSGLHAAGRQRDALRSAHEYRTQLRENWGLDPSAAFDGLERNVATAGFADLGCAGSIAIRASGTPPGDVRLPDQPTTFHGRRVEGVDLSGLLTVERLVTLLGAGGIGKTRLALHAAALAVTAFPDGVWFCTLADLHQAGPDSVPYAVADAIGIRPQEGTTMTDTLAAWIGRRRALLVLDNCEHVRDASSTLASLLLRRCPALTVLATSREPLRLPGETRSFVGPLDPSAARALFVDRLRAFDVSATQDLVEDDVAALCEQLGNMPLAIELAAARCRATSPAELSARLEERPELLADRSRPPTQQTLTAVIDWSVGHLDPLARQVFARLSVFHGGCTLEQAEHVVAGGDVDGADVLDALQALVDAGLVTVLRAVPVVRYLQLEPIRQHGARLLDADQRAELAHRHGLAFAELSAAIGRGLQGPEFAHWADTADRELANLRAAHRWAISNQDAEVAVGIVAGLREYLNERVMTEICDWNDATVAATRGRGDQLENVALAAAAIGWMHQRRHREIIDAFDRIRADSLADADLVAQAAWAAGRIPFQLLGTLEALAFALALRGAPGPAHTLLAAIDASGGSTFGWFRPTMAKALAAISPAAERASRQRAAGFTTIDDVAEFARATIRDIQGDHARR